MRDSEGASKSAGLSTVKGHAPSLLAIALLVVMVTLMAVPVKEESATVDESMFLAMGYSYWHGYGFNLDPEAPPLAKMISAAPLLFMNVKLPMHAQQLLDRRVGAVVTRQWSGEMRLVDKQFPIARGSWYYWPFMEAQMLGQDLVYGGANDADKLLAAGRWMQVALTVLTGIVIFFWLRRLSGGMAGAFGVALWALNPLALAYGHLVLTDMGETLMLVLAVWCFATFLEQPSVGRAALCGLACGGALTMKFTGPVLAPILLVLAVAFAMTRKGWGAWGKHAFVIPVVAAGVVLAVYAPYWNPAPPLSTERGATLGVPMWFQVLRPILIPPGFFKGLALQAAHAAAGHQAFLRGQWRMTGWWYYFPVALALKLPLPWLVLAVVGLLLWLMGLRRFSFPLTVPWVAAVVYLLLAMMGTINIGIRYVLPIIPLLAVGIASQFSLRSRRVQAAAWLCTGWLLLVTWRACPYFIEYFNEIAGGPSNGYRWLVDSNLDWGQDVKRLKHFLDEQSMTNINLVYFGPDRSIDYHGISARRVTASEGYGMHHGTLVVSATELMAFGWDWLRACHEPVARVGYTMFVYHLEDADTKDRWEQILRIQPNDAQAHYNLGIVLERAGDDQGAISHYEQSIRINPDFAMAHYNLAIALQRAGKVVDAIEHFEQVLRIGPDFAEPHFNLGIALGQAGRIPEAIGQLQQAVRIKPDFAEAYYNLGIALGKAGRVPEAIAQYEQALQIKPDFPKAQSALARLQARQ